MGSGPARPGPSTTVRRGVGTSERLPGDALIELELWYGLRQRAPIRERLEEIIPGGWVSYGGAANAQIRDGRGWHPGGAGLRSAGAIRGGSAGSPRCATSADVLATALVVTGEEKKPVLAESAGLAA